MFHAFGWDYNLNLTHKRSARYTFFVDKAEQPEIFHFVPFGIVLQYLRDGYQVRSILVCVGLIFRRNGSVCFITLDDIAVFYQNLFAFRNDRIEWLI